MFSKYSFAEKLIAFGFVISLLAFPFVVLITLQESNKAQMDKQAQEVSTAITSLRTFYASDVVGRLQAAGSDVVVSENYKSIEGGIPIPATFSIEISEMFGTAHQDAQLGYAFVSDYPFQSRQRPALDTFQSAALKAFRQNRDLKVFKLADVPLLGTAQYRYASPIHMLQACVNCHNNHPLSIKRDWQVGDVRGIQEVSVSAVETNFFDFRYLHIYFLFISLLAMLAVVVFRKSAIQLSVSNRDLEEARKKEQSISAELKRKVDELALLGAVADKSTFGVSIADCRRPDMPLIYVNDAFCQMTGMSKEMALGHNCRFLKGPLTSQEASTGLRQAIDKGLPYTAELLNYRENATTFWNRLTIFPVGGSPGKPDFYVGYQVDVTALREADEERAAMLIEIQEGQKLESLGILVAGVSHEINNPLGIALTAASHVTRSAQALIRNLESKGLLNDAVREFLEDEQKAFNLVQVNLTRAAALVRDFKEIATDRSQKSIRSVDLKAYLDSIAGSFVPLMRRTRVKLVVTVNDPMEIRLDTGTFGQLITNLVVNATIHAFNGVKNPEIRIEAVLNAGKIEITVADNGTGISPAVMSKLFSPFFTTKRTTGGTGLGLYIAKRIATAELGGDLTAENQLCGGAVFRLVFPLKGPSE